jgi:hypothetical protein
MSVSEIPQSRVYRHTKCGGDTVVGENAFQNMSNPLADMTRTWCVHCNGYFPVAEYQWSDTNESLPDYYARHSVKATPLQRFLCSRKMMLILGGTGLVLGAIGGYLLVRNGNFGQKALMVPFGGFGGLFVGCAIYVSVLCEPITRRVCGVKDTRTLV